VNASIPHEKIVDTFCLMPQIASSNIPLLIFMTNTSKRLRDLCHNAVISDSQKFTAVPYRQTCSRSRKRMKRALSCCCEWRGQSLLQPDGMTAFATRDGRVKASYADINKGWGVRADT